MTLASLSRLTAFTVTAVVLLLAFSVLTPAPGRAAKGGKGGGGGTSGNEKWPSTIVVSDAAGNGLRNDGDGDYVDNTPNPGDVEAFVGSQAKEGDIILNLRPISATLARHVALDFEAGNTGACGAPPPISELVENHSEGGSPSTNHFNLQHLEVNVSDGVIDGEKLVQGVYNMDPGDVVLVSMRLLVRDDVDQLWFLNYGSGEKKLCAKELGTGNYPVLVEHLGTPDGDGRPVWRVSSTGVACLEKHNGAGGKTEKCGSHDMPFQFTAKPLQARP